MAVIVANPKTREQGPSIVVQEKRLDAMLATPGMAVIGR